jgi:hypothetical protein
VPRQVDDDVEGGGDDLHVRHGPVAALSEVDEAEEAAVAVDDQLTAAAGRGSRGEL